MDSASPLKITANGRAITAATARIILQHALEREARGEDDEDPEIARNRAINAHTGATMYLPPKVTLAEDRAWKRTSKDPIAHPTAAGSSD